MPFLDLFKNFRKDEADKKAEEKIHPATVENPNLRDEPNQRQQNFVDKVLEINKAKKIR